MQNSRTKLYDLISSLSPSEKRYFKIHSTTHTIGDENKYLTLFDTILDFYHENGKYHEGKLKSKLSKLKDVKRLDLLKAHLFKKILKSLEAYHKEKSINDQLRSFQNQAEILNKKELPDLALGIIDKGITIAEKYEKWYFVLQFLELQRSINYSLQKLTTNNNKERSILTKAINLGNYRKLQSRLWKLFLEKGLPINESERSKYAQLINSKLMESEDSALSRKAKIIQLYLLQFNYGMQGNMKKTCFYGESLVELLESDREFIKEDGGMYLRSLFNLQLAYMRLSRHDEVLEIIQKIRNASKEIHTNPALKYSIGLNLFINEFETNQILKPTINQDKLIAAMKVHYTQHKVLLRVPNKYLYYWQNATYHFDKGQLHESQDWLNKIMDLKSTFRIDIQSLARILNIIIHFELENRKLIIHFLRSTNRYLIKKDQLYSVEKILLSCIKQLSSKIESKKDQLNIFKNLNKELKKLELDEQGHQALRMLGFEKWISSKLKQHKSKTNH